VLTVQGREARDILIGNLFGCGAIARMVKLQQSSSAPNAVSLARLVQEIMCLAQKKGVHALLPADCY